MGLEMAKAVDKFRRASVLEIAYSADLQSLRKIPVGTVEWPGQPVRHHLASGASISPELRASAELALAGLRDSMEAAGPSKSNDKLGLIAEMLLAYPGAGATPESSKARGAAYLYALEDLPPWAVQQAIRLWHRGECGERNYNWAPAPAILRDVALQQIEPIQKVIAECERTLSAIPFEEAMDSRKKPALVPTLRRIK